VEPLMAKKRVDGRTARQLRPVKLVKQPLEFADASCLVKWGSTHVICAATVQEGVPKFLTGQGRGWLTAEYGMLPRSSAQRIEREAVRGKISGRTSEIQRLIGRSLRSVVDLAALGERTLLIDCDVIQADGGTRCASITGSFVALALAVKTLLKQKAIAKNPLKDFISAVSVGMVAGQALLDLNYAEDSTAEVDMNIIMTGRGGFVELQGTAEGRVFSQRQLNQLIALGKAGTRTLTRLQQQVLGVNSIRALR
jgi:ribonuclease PH